MIPAVHSPPWWQSQIARSSLGIALAFVAGTTVWWVPQLWGSHDMFDSEGALSSVVIVSFALAFAAGVLLRTLWALLIVPVAWALGEAAALAVGVLTLGGGDWTNFWPATIALLQVGVLPVVFAAGLGMILGMWLQQRGRTTRTHGSLPA